MKPDWDKLAEELDDSTKVLIADVDCTADGKSLCEDYQVRGYPTIKYFSPPDEEGEDYKGGRDFDSLKKFALELGPSCSVGALENCSDEQKKDLEEYIAMPAEERDAMTAELKKTLSDAESAQEALLKQLQAPRHRRAPPRGFFFRGTARPPAPPPPPPPGPPPRRTRSQRTTSTSSRRSWSPFSSCSRRRRRRPWRRPRPCWRPRPTPTNLA
jgi:hypothetical protein